MILHSLMMEVWFTSMHPSIHPAPPTPIWCNILYYTIVEFKLVYIIYIYIYVYIWRFMSIWWNPYPVGVFPLLDECYTHNCTWQVSFKTIHAFVCVCVYTFINVDIYLFSFFLEYKVGRRRREAWIPRVHDKISPHAQQGLFMNDGNDNQKMNNNLFMLFFIHANLFLYLRYDAISCMQCVCVCVFSLKLFVSSSIYSFTFTMSTMLSSFLTCYFVCFWLCCDFHIYNLCFCRWSWAWFVITWKLCALVYLFPKRISIWILYNE